MMDDRWMDLLESMGVYAASAKEQEQLEKGMAFYLRTHGLGEEADDYGLGFAKRRMEEIAPEKRKEFLIAAPLLWQYEKTDKGEEKKRYELAMALEAYPSLTGFWEPLL